MMCLSHAFQSINTPTGLASHDQLAFSGARINLFLLMCAVFLNGTLAACWCVNQGHLRLIRLTQLEM